MIDNKKKDKDKEANPLNSSQLVAAFPEVQIQTFAPLNERSGTEADYIHTRS